MRVRDAGLLTVGLGGFVALGGVALATEGIYYAINGKFLGE
jgi:hypothetical protein